MSLPLSSSACRSVASCWSCEMTAMCEAERECEPVITATIMPPVIRTGINTVEKMNDRVRTRSRYSRFAMSQTLRIDLASNLFDKDLFQRWLLHLEPVDARASLHSVGQQRLRIGRRSVHGVQLDLCPATVHLRVFDRRMLQKARVSLEKHLHAVAWIVRL